MLAFFLESIMGIYLTLHLLAVSIWVGGMFFAYMILRPESATQLEPPVRLKHWRGIFSRFFPWVWVCIVLLPVTGILMMNISYGGFELAPANVKVMTYLAIAMILIFLHVNFAPFNRLKKSLDNKDIPAAAKSLNQIRLLVGTNVLLGVVTIAIATAGKFYL